MSKSPGEILIETLCDSDVLPNVTPPIQLLETHISWVLLTGSSAWKIKKPVDLGFVDFTTLSKRKFCCEEELRLNRRLAPDLYLGMVGFTGTPERPQLWENESQTEIFEYAVKMKEFPQEMLLPAVLKRGELTVNHLEALARTIARFQSEIPIAGKEDPCGTPMEVCQPQRENLRILRKSLRSPQWHSQLDHLEQWSESEFARGKRTFSQRKTEGRIREGHGDLHLGNMVLLDDQITVFDCIEFNPNFRWIDVISEIAFLVMDLEDRNHPGFAWRFLNCWLEQTGDYSGLKVLRYYLCYRASVRAKVNALRLTQSHMTQEEIAKAVKDLGSYLQLAESYTQQGQPFLMITHGVSGVGKSVMSGQLMEDLQAVRLRSDVERKRLFGLDPFQPADGKETAHIYFPESTQRAFHHMADVARTLLECGIRVIIDATNLRIWHRKLFADVAASQSVPFVILDLQADIDRLESNLHMRKQMQIRDASDAGVEVMRSQLQTREPLTQEELTYAVSIDTGHGWNREKVLRLVQEQLDQLM